MVYTIHFWRLGGWFILAIPTLPWNCSFSMGSPGFLCCLLYHMHVFFETMAKIIGNATQNEGGLLWTQPHPENQRFLCLSPFLCDYCVSARFRIEHFIFPCFFLTMFSHIFTHTRCLKKRPIHWEVPVKMKQILLSLYWPGFLRSWIEWDVDSKDFLLLCFMQWICVWVWFSVCNCFFLISTERLNKPYVVGSFRILSEAGQS